MGGAVRVMKNRELNSEPEHQPTYRARVGSEAGRHQIATRERLARARLTIVISAPPCDRGSDKPFRTDHSRLVRPVMQPEASLSFVAEADFTRAFRTCEVTEGAVKNQAAKVEQTGVRAVQFYEQISRAGAWLKLNREQSARGITDASASGWEFGTSVRPTAWSRVRSRGAGIGT